MVSRGRGRHWSISGTLAFGPGECGFRDRAEEVDAGVEVVVCGRDEDADMAKLVDGEGESTPLEPLLLDSE